MGLLTDLLSFPVAGPFQGMRFILEQIQTAADDMSLDEDRFEAEMMDLELRHDQGEISDEDYEAQETELLETFNMMHSQQHQFGEIESEDLDGSNE